MNTRNSNPLVIPIALGATIIAIGIVIAASVLQTDGDSRPVAVSTATATPTLTTAIPSSMPQISPQGPSPREFRTKVNSLCRRLKPQVSESDAVSAARSLADQSRKLYGALSRINAPRGMKQDFRYWLFGYADFIRLNEEIATAFATGETAQAQAAFERLTAVQGQISTEAHRLGIVECAS